MVSLQKYRWLIFVCLFLVVLEFVGLVKDPFQFENTFLIGKLNKDLVFPSEHHNLFSINIVE